MANDARLLRQVNKPSPDGMSVLEQALKKYQRSSVILPSILKVFLTLLLLRLLMWLTSEHCWQLLGTKVQIAKRSELHSFAVMSQH